ncbi:unannotated protein [freshwater metagenome]|uniref:Unannotated protein n=1 Tax=freshwater metagenome TaxID=449393 RepID=A0A6J7FSA0_9ZZZZ|nr:hypothetical protein [Actinomycetota bacterium]
MHPPDEVAGLWARHEEDRRQLLLYASRLAELETELGDWQAVRTGLEHHIAEQQRQIQANEQALDELQRWRHAVERSRMYALLRLQLSLYELAIIGPFLRLIRRTLSRIARPYRRYVPGN